VAVAALVLKAMDDLVVANKATAADKAAAEQEAAIAVRNVADQATVAAAFEENFKPWNGNICVVDPFEQEKKQLAVESSLEVEMILQRAKEENNQILPQFNYK
jgi:hypothetical protein